MAQFKYGGQMVDVAEDWTIGELVGAENALKIDMEEARGASRIALVAYISIKRANPQAEPFIVADSVLSMSLSSITGDEEEEASPPASDPAEEEGGDTSEEEQESGQPPTIGRLPSASSA